MDLTAATTLSTGAIQSLGTLNLENLGIKSTFKTTEAVCQTQKSATDKGYATSIIALTSTGVLQKTRVTAAISAGGKIHVEISPFMEMSDMEDEVDGVSICDRYYWKRLSDE